MAESWLIVAIGKQSSDKLFLPQIGKSQASELIERTRLYGNIPRV